MKNLKVVVTNLNEKFENPAAGNLKDGLCYLENNAENLKEEMGNPKKWVASLNAVTLRKETDVGDPKEVDWKKEKAEVLEEKVENSNGVVETLKKGLQVLNEAASQLEVTQKKMDPVWTSQLKVKIRKVQQRFKIL